MLRVLLPPNLAAAAARNAIAVRIELAPDPAPDPALLPALTWIQRQTGAPSRPPLFLQFTRGQLRELIALAEDQPVFFWVNRPLEPIVWDDGLLPGASEHLDDPDLPPPPPAPPAAAPKIHRPKAGAPDPVGRFVAGFESTSANARCRATVSR